jgi:hypothetical protein
VKKKSFRYRKKSAKKVDEKENLPAETEVENPKTEKRRKARKERKKAEVEPSPSAPEKVS